VVTGPPGPILKEVICGLLIAVVIATGALPPLWSHRSQIASPQPLSEVKKGSLWTRYAITSPEGDGAAKEEAVPLISLRRNST
jgi:hypothetical protein